MRIKQRSWTMNFLLELLLAIVFFAFSAIICVQLFGGAKNLNDQAIIESKSLIKINSVSERVKANDKDLMSEVVNEFKIIYYDEDFNVTDSVTLNYNKIIKVSESEYIQEYEIEYWYNKSVIHTNKVVVFKEGLLHE